ncbi:MAG: SPOR domain-containing protein [Pigmentiphaga sp.]|nr:SPOR domain-containing protein [Pigmentiphaga sp.]
MARSKQSSRNRTERRGGALFGVMAGVVLGLLVAAAVAVYISGAPVPFVDRASRGPDPIPTLGQRPDPNLGLSSAGIAPPPSILVPAPTVPTSPPAGAGQPPGAGAAGRPGAASPSAPQEADALGALVASLGNRGASAPAPIPTAPAGRYILQVGAYRVLEEAEALKARLALLGFEARVHQAMVNGVLVNRVQVGPYANVEAMNQARERLTANQVESTVVRN